MSIALSPRPYCHLMSLFLSSKGMLSGWKSARTDSSGKEQVGSTSGSHTNYFSMSKDYVFWMAVVKINPLTKTKTKIHLSMRILVLCCGYTGTA